MVHSFGPSRVVQGVSGKSWTSLRAALSLECDIHVQKKDPPSQYMGGRWVMAKGHNDQTAVLRLLLSFHTNDCTCFIKGYKTLSAWLPDTGQGVIKAFELPHFPSPRPGVTTPRGHRGSCLGGQLTAACLVHVIRIGGQPIADVAAHTFITHSSLQPFALLRHPSGLPLGHRY